MITDVRTLRRIATQFSLRFAGIALLFLQDALLINLYGKTFFGHLVFYISAVQIAAMIGVLGQNNYLVFLLVRYRNRGDRDRALRAIWFAMVVSLVGSLATGFTLSAVVSQLFRSLTVNPLMLAFATISVAVFEVLRQVFRVIDRENITEVLLLVAQPICLILVATATWLMLGDAAQLSATLPGLLYTGSTALLALATGSYVIIFKPGLPAGGAGVAGAGPLAARYTANWFRLYRLWFRQGSPLVFSGLFTNFQQRVDVFVLGLFVQPEMLSVYQILSRISLLGLFVLRSVQSVFFARFARLVAQKAYDQARKLHRRSTLMSTLGTILSFLFSLALEPLFTAAFHISIYGHMLLFSMLYSARLMLSLAGGAPIFLQMTPKRLRLPRFFIIAVAAFVIPYPIFYALHGTVDALASGVALVLFNFVYAGLCSRELKRHLRIS